MMRRFRATPLVMTFAAGTALAQTPDTSAQVQKPEQQQQAPASPDTGKPAEQPQVPMPGAQGQLDVSGVYTVKTGDTLWDLSGQFLNNPWYWPKIWADNPSVENPHWIYPGNRLKIRQNGEGAPGEVSPHTEETPSAAYTGSELPATRGELPDISKGTLKADPTMLTADGDQVEFTPYKVPTFLRVRVQTLITDRELADTGVITNSFEQKGLLTTYDKVYVQFEKLEDVKVGSVYSIFRPREPVLHPVTKKQFGYQTDLLGSMKITGKVGKLAVGEIGPVSSYIERGDRITLGAALEKTVQRARNTANVQGVVLATDIPLQTAIAESHVIFIDKGSKDGVQDGNLFNVYQTGDGLEKLVLGGELSARPDQLPIEPVAQLMIFYVRDHSSAAMVLRSIREVNVGDPVEMRAEPAEGAGGDAH